MRSLQIPHGSPEHSALGGKASHVGFNHPETSLSALVAQVEKALLAQVEKSETRNGKKPADKMLVLPSSKWDVPFCSSFSLHYEDSPNGLSSQLCWWKF